jgi:hypothetical protein
VLSSQSGNKSIQVLTLICTAIYYEVTDSINCCYSKGLPSEVKNVFRDLTVDTPLPERHKNMVLKNEKCDDDVVDDLNLDESESATQIDVEIESDLYGDFNDFLEVDVVSIDDDEPEGKSLNLEWPCSPNRKN